MAIGVVSTGLLEEVLSGLMTILMNAFVNGLAMAIYVPLMLYINWKMLPPSAKPHWVNLGVTGVVGAIYVGFAVYALYTMALIAMA